MTEIDASGVIQRLSAKIAELTATIAFLETALENATAEPEVRE